MWLDGPWGRHKWKVQGLAQPDPEEVLALAPVQVTPPVEGHMRALSRTVSLVASIKHLLLELELELELGLDQRQEAHGEATLAMLPLTGRRQEKKQDNEKKPASGPRKYAARLRKKPRRKKKLTGPRVHRLRSKNGNKCVLARRSSAKGKHGSG